MTVDPIIVNFTIALLYIMLASVPVCFVVKAIQSLVENIRKSRGFDE